MRKPEDSPPGTGAREHQTPGSSAHATDGAGVDNPAIDKCGQARKRPLCRIDQPAVKFIYIKATEKDRRIKWFAFAIAVENYGHSHADQDCGNGQRRNNCDSLPFVRKNKKSLREEAEATD